MPPPPAVHELVERFERNLSSYRSGKYNETQVRREFLDPFFESLGWDVNNKLGYAEAYKDVIHEDAIKIGGSTKAPDYSFRIGGIRKFFVEAKKPSINIKRDTHPAYQLRRYAWSSKLPLSVLTDFEEFAVYDCRIKPEKTDKASTARVFYFTYDQYIQQWDEIVGVFSKDAILKGSFDKYADSVKLKRGTAEVDDAFLAEIEHWREILARNLALRNPNLSQRDLNFAVQRTIDRIIFLRIAEDRGIEPYGELREAAKSKNVYARFLERFQRADARYNSGLFYFAEEKEREDYPDRLTPQLQLDDAPLKEIVRKLYYPDSPYEFSVLPADILGQVYEQFLGKVIRLTSDHRALVEEKPEVKKAGGVYYTPTFVVEHIVQQTVDRMLEGKNPTQASKIKILDPACGSGSFLISAYQHLLDWHLTYYVEDEPEKWAQGKKPKIYQGQNEDWRLTTDSKKEILLNNIYGTDIDAQAVEVTKLSLLLKVLEGENAETLRQFSLFEERVLPDLAGNIKCGNSLIAPDYYQGQQIDLLDEDTIYRINVFDWDSEFPEIFKRKDPGFDIILGNPPYVRQEMLKEIKPYLQRHYESYQGTADLYVYFIERSLNLLREGGLYSIIVSKSLLYTDYGSEIRRFVSEKTSIQSFIDFGGLAVFEKAKDTYTCIPLIANDSQAKQVRIAQVPSLIPPNLSLQIEGRIHEVPPERFSETTWTLRTQREVDAFRKIQELGEPLSDFIDNKIYYGIKTGLNDAFVLDPDKKERLVSEDPNSLELIKRFVGGQEIRRYYLRDNPRFLIAIPNGWTRKHMGITTSEKDAWDWFHSNYNPIARHLHPYVDRAKKRYDKGEYWWELRPCEYYHVLEGRKIIYPDIAKHPRFYLDTTGAYITNTAYCLGVSDPYLLAILNSKVFWFSIGHLSIPFGTRGGKYRYRLIYQYMKNIPIRRLDDKNERREQLAKLATQLQGLHERQTKAFTGHDKALIGRQINALDKQVDHLVYELYDLTDDEIVAVEAAP